MEVFKNLTQKYLIFALSGCLLNFRHISKRTGAKVLEVNNFCVLPQSFCFAFPMHTVVILICYTNIS